MPYSQKLVEEFASDHPYLTEKPTPPRRLRKYTVTTSATTLQLELYETDYQYFFAQLPRGRHAFDLLIDKASWILAADGFSAPTCPA